MAITGQAEIRVRATQRNPRMKEARGRALEVACLLFQFYPTPSTARGLADAGAANPLCFTRNHPGIGSSVAAVGVGYVVMVSAVEESGEEPYTEHTRAPNLGLRRCGKFPATHEQLGRQRPPESTRR